MPILHLLFFHSGFSFFFGCFISFMIRGDLGIKSNQSRNQQRQQLEFSDGFSAQAFSHKSCRKIQQVKSARVSSDKSGSKFSQLTLSGCAIGEHGAKYENRFSNSRHKAERFPRRLSFGAGGSHRHTEIAKGLDVNPYHA